MSYINEALKKAQKEKEAKSINYIGSPEISGEMPLPFYRKQFFYALIFIFTIIVILYLHPGLNFLSGNDRGGIREAPSVEIMDEQLEENNPVTKAESAPIDPAGKNEIIDADISQDENLYDKAVSLRKQGLTEEAKSVYRKALILNPGNTRALNDLGVLLLHEGEFDQAESYLEKAVRLNPGDVNPYYNLACLHALNGNGQEGIEYLQKAVEIDTRVRDWITKDADLEGLKDLPGFNEIFK